MKNKNNSPRVGRSRRVAKTSAAPKPQAKAVPVSYARETFVAARLIRQEVAISLAKAPDLG